MLAQPLALFGSCVEMREGEGWGGEGEVSTYQYLRMKYVHNHD